MSESEHNIRTYNGHNNNLAHPFWGAACQPLLAIAEADDCGFSEARTGPNPRAISNAVCWEEIPLLNRRGLSGFVWVWAQLLEHELSFIAEDETSPLPVPVPANDICAAGTNMLFYRSKRCKNRDAAHTGHPLNRRSSYIDASSVYGFDETKADSLRAFDGSGKLRTSNGALLPLVIDRDQSFLAGDDRVNENVVLTALHTLLMREHNRRCDVIMACCPQLSGNDEALYQRARRYIGALLQVITYEEFIPALLGEMPLSRYRGYDSAVNATVSNVFAGAVGALGYSMCCEHIRVENNLGELLLADTFFRPDLIIEYGIEPFVAGLMRQRMREVNAGLVESVRNCWRRKPGHGREESRAPDDLAAYMIMRGRDLRLPDYNSCREAFYLAANRDFTDITRDAAAQDRLREAYHGNISQLDPWIAGLAEDHCPGANVGELFLAVLKDQFERCRDGDRFWYENDQLLVQELEETRETPADLKRRRLANVIRDNTSIKLLHRRVFYASP
jgi:hypothetical protein